MPRKNEAVAELLDNIARLLALKDDEPFRIRAYTDASRAVTSLTNDVAELHRAGELEEIPGVGPSIAAKIGEYLDTGRSTYVEQLTRELAPEATDLLEVPSIGPARARLIHDHLGVSTIPELERAAREHRLRSVPGIGDTLEARIAEEAAHALDRTGRGRVAVAVPATSSGG
jgi:DNA polymerase (family 10)